MSSAPKKPKISLNQTLGPDGMFARNWCETEYKMHKVDYVWVIHNYNFYKVNSSKGVTLKSPVFNATTNTGCKWHLELFPNGKKGTTSDASALYLFFDSSSIREKIDRVMAEYKFAILDENQKEVNVFRNGGIRNFGLYENESGGCANFIKNDYVLPLSGKLTIYCEIQYYLSDNTSNAIVESNSTKIDPNVPELRLSNDFGQLFNDEESSDVVISVNGKNFKAHKLILSARSPVFAAMFAHKDMKETRENKVIINDFDEQIVEEMLKYIYTGKSENLDKLADNLLMIAEKYQLKGLKDMSERTLVRNLSVKNAIDVLLFADFHGADKLKSDVINFIVKRSAQVMKTTAWKNIVVSHPQLVVEVCEAFPSK